MSWTDDQIFRVRRLAGEGKSSSQIARILGDGITKNRVVALCYRTRPRIPLSARSGPKVDRSPTKRLKPAAPAAREPVAAPPRTGLTFFILEEEGGNVHHDSLKVGDDRCRYPLWPDRMGTAKRPKLTELYYCGAPTDGGPWCKEHHDIVYMPAMAKSAPGRGRKVNADGRRAGWQYGT